MFFGGRPVRRRRVWSLAHVSLKRHTRIFHIIFYIGRSPGCRVKCFSFFLLVQLIQQVKSYYNVIFVNLKKKINLTRLKVKIF